MLEGSEEYQKAMKLLIIILGILIIVFATIETTKYARSQNPNTLCKQMGYDAGEYENFKDGKIMWDSELICYNKIFAKKIFANEGVEE